MYLSEIIEFLEELAPPVYQENYDNSGLICGQKDMLLSKSIICLDVIEEVVDEAIQKGANLIIAHHPIVFKGLKSFTGKNYVERVIIKAIKNDIAIYAIHTNLDNVSHGVNHKIASLLNLKNTSVLAPKSDVLSKLIFYTPKKEVQRIKEALFHLGAGKVGNYSETGFDSVGTGFFKGNTNSNPKIGKINQNTTVEETKTEMVFPRYLQHKIVAKLIELHPYEEPAFDIIPLANKHSEIGAGMIGELETEYSTPDFLKFLKNIFRCSCIRHTKLVHKKIKKVALCGGSGSFLLQDALRQQADIFITGDFKYHEFFDAENKLIIADIGHYESEQFTNELLYDKLKEKFLTFAFLLTEVNTNPVEYYI